MRFDHLFASTLAVLASVALSAVPATAVPPPNDAIGGATAIALPFGETLDTTEATTDAEDAAINANCGAPFTDASVWYSLTPANDALIFVDVSASSYSAGLIVATGTPGNLSIITCGPVSVAFQGIAGESYFILAFDDQSDGGSNGGLLSISVSEASPPPEISLTVDPVGHFNARTGTATLTGTFTCSGEALFAGVDGTLDQPVGRRAVVNGSFFTVPVCDGTTHSWTAEVFPNGGKFAGGRGTVHANAFACGFFDCSEDFVEQSVKLRGGH